MAALGGLEFVLYLTLFAATKVASRHPDPVKASERLRWQSNVLMLLLVTNACWLAVQSSSTMTRSCGSRRPCWRSASCFFAALRLHMSRISYALGVAPPVGTLIWIAVDWSDPLAVNHYALAMLSSSPPSWW